MSRSEQEAQLTRYLDQLRTELMKKVELENTIAQLEKMLKEAERNVNRLKVDIGELPQGKTMMESGARNDPSGRISMPDKVIHTVSGPVILSRWKYIVYDPMPMDNRAMQLRQVVDEQEHLEYSIVLHMDMDHGSATLTHAILFVCEKNGKLVQKYLQDENIGVESDPFFEVFPEDDRV